MLLTDLTWTGICSGVLSDKPSELSLQYSTQSAWVSPLNNSHDLFTLRYLFKPMDITRGNTEAEVGSIPQGAWRMQ